MEGIHKSRSPGTIKGKIITYFHNNSGVMDECALANIKRIYYYTLVAILLRIFYILMFTADTHPATPRVWSRGIITSHFTLLFFYIGVLILTHRIKNNVQPSTAIHVLQYLVPIVLMASSVIIVVLDQLVTTNITPFLLSCLIVGAIFLLRPLVSFIVFLASYIGYFYLMAMTTINQQVLLSNRVNGVAAVGIGFLISTMAWNYNYTNITQRKYIEKQQKQLEQMAYFDSLTSLPNRHYFNKVIAEEFSLMQRHGHRSVIMILDIDDFKNINDTYGHVAGDRVLKQLAGLLINFIQGCGTVSRFGGEEFVVLVPAISLEEGVELAEKLRKIIAEKEFTTNSLPGAVPLQITASFGVSLLQQTKTHGLENYFSRADKALYLAKKRGKNRVEKM